MNFQKIKNLDNQHHMSLYARKPVCFTHGERTKLYDTTGKEYTDFLSGIAVNCLGYNFPPLVSAITRQAKKLMHISNLFYSEPQAKLAKELVESTEFEKVAFCNSGAEANEMAIKLARKYFYDKNEKKHKIVCALDSFHGRTLATVTATGQDKYKKPFVPLPEGFLHVPYNDLGALKKLLAEDNEIAAVMLECIQGESGIKPATHEYLIGTYALCKQKGILMILDEVQTGMGRTSKMFAFEHYGISPDIITLAKGLGAGFPIGACLARAEVASTFSPGDHGTTFGGNPLACTAALVVLDELKNKGRMEKVERRGLYLGERLAKFKKYNFVKDIRGLGLLWAIELDEKLKNSEVAGKMMNDKGYIIGTAGNNTLRFAPPYRITKVEIDAMVKALEELFAETNL
ncbi:MAG: aspartate aminotransferase family protein [Firmicutes bacterium]|nr:aspartate aminotransferase family protein [Bacillota bacterium]